MINFSDIKIPYGGIVIKCSSIKNRQDIELALTALGYKPFIKDLYDFRIAPNIAVYSDKEYSSICNKKEETRKVYISSDINFTQSDLNFTQDEQE